MTDNRLPQLGKATPEFFDEVIFPRLGAADDSVIIGPTHGVDFAAVEVGGQALVMSTDPFFIAPSLGWERAAWFALHIIASDVAVSGIPPRFLVVDLNLPPEMDERTLRTVWNTVHEECARLGIAVVSGHTARYAGCAFPMVGGATVLGVGGPERKLTLRFASPTTFRRTEGETSFTDDQGRAYQVAGHNVPLPLPGLVFDSYLQRWNAFAPVALHPDVKRYAEECVAISRYRLQTVLVEFGAARHVGFVGSCQFLALLVHDPYWLRLLNLLAAFAFYAGTGHRTTMGLGQTRVISLRSKVGGRTD